jgi:hypothetical protein
MKTEKIWIALYNSANFFQHKIIDIFNIELGLDLDPPAKWPQESFIDFFIIWCDASLSKINDFAKKNKDLSFFYWINEIKNFREAIEECKQIEIKFEELNQFLQDQKAEIDLFC